MLSQTTAAILAGGLGTRLRSAVPDRPKALAEVAGRPFLSYLLDQLVEAGVQDVVLLTGHLGHQVQGAFGSSYRGLRLAYSQESSPLGTAGALRLALPQLASSSVLVMNGDSYCGADLRAFWEWRSARAVDAALVLTQVPNVDRFGCVQADEAGHVLRFVEKGGAHRPGWINAGIYALSRELLADIPEGRAVSLEHECFPAWLGRLGAWRSNAAFLDIGIPESYVAAEAFFAARRAA
jgi:NDP-sugar pyrophosphorylase family protein